MELKVVVYKRPNMFIVNESPINMLGVSTLKSLFHDEGFKDTSSFLTILYPERFLNVLEQRDLINRISKQNYINVNIVTHSCFIIQTVPKDYLRVVNDEPINEDEKPFIMSNNASGLFLNFENLFNPQVSS